MQFSECEFSWVESSSVHSLSQTGAVQSEVALSVCRSIFGDSFFVPKWKAPAPYTNRCLIPQKYHVIMLRCQDIKGGHHFAINLPCQKLHSDKLQEKPDWPQAVSMTFGVPLH